MIGIFKEIRCTTAAATPAKACHQLLFRLAEPWVMEVKCPRCRTVMLLRFDPSTGLPVGQPAPTPDGPPRALAR